MKLRGNVKIVAWAEMVTVMKDKEGNTRQRKEKENGRKSNEENKYSEQPMTKVRADD